MQRFLSCDDFTTDPHGEPGRIPRGNQTGISHAPDGIETRSDILSEVENRQCLKAE
jgi:hypothetical protein